MLHQCVFAVQIALAWWFALSLVASMLLLAARPLVRAWLRNPHDAGAPLAIRLLPAAASMGIVLTLVLPAFAWLEPLGSAARGERLGLTGTLLAAAGGALLVASFSRGLAAVVATRRRMRELLGRGLPSHAIAGAPLFVSDSRAPCLLLDGLVRPKLFVSRSVLDRLTAAELERAVAHELAHHRAHDNFKRRLIAFAPDLLSGSRVADELEQAWKHSAELEADAAASRGSAAEAVTLASALLKVARLCGSRPPLDFGRAAFHDGAPVAERIRQLCAARPVRRERRAPVSLLVRGGVLAVLAAVAFDPYPVLAAIHRVTELLVHLP